MDIKIRRAEAFDIEGMSVVVDSAWRENYRGIFKDETIDKYTGQHRRESFERLLKNGADIFVLTVDGEVAALCAFQMTVIMPDCAEIMLMYVHHEYQKRGLGGRLFSYTLNELRREGFRSAVLDTAEKNEDARRFYEKFGFRYLKSFEQEIRYITYIITL